MKKEKHFLTSSLLIVINRKPDLELRVSGMHYMLCGCEISLMIVKKEVNNQVSGMILPESKDKTRWPLDPCSMVQFIGNIKLIGSGQYYSDSKVQFIVCRWKQVIFM